MAEPEEGEEQEGPAEAQTVDVANPRSQRRARQKQLTEAENAQLFWKRVFADPMGRKAMWDLLETTGTFTREIGHVNGLPDVFYTGYRAGRLDFGQQLYHSWLKADRDGVNLMLDEYHPDFAQPKPVKPIGTDE